MSFRYITIKKTPPEAENHFIHNLKGETSQCKGLQKQTFFHL